MKTRSGVRRTLIFFALAVTYACSPAAAGSGMATSIPLVAKATGVKAEGRLEPARYAELSPMVTGVVSKVLVAEGQTVEAGDLIASLDAPTGQDLDAARERTAVELGSAYEDLRLATRRLDEYPVPGEFLGMRAEQAARAWLTELDAAREAFAPYKGDSKKTLKPRHVLNERVYPNLPRRVLVDTREYTGVAAEYKKRLDVAWVNYTRAVEWLALDAEVRQAQARVGDAKRRLESLDVTMKDSVQTGTRNALASSEIRAPLGGTITRMDLKVGEVATAGVPVVTVADISSWIVKTTDLTEIDVASLKEAAPAVIIFDTVPNDELEGRVLTVHLSYADRDGDVVYPVDVALTESRPWLRWGMTAEIRFTD